MKLNQISTLHKNSKGFTLIELMIVVAIIGILAAIAIPQFAAYRMRGFNASAVSDAKNLQTSQAAFFADNQLYAVSGAGPATALNTPKAALVTGPAVLANSNILQWVGGTSKTMQISVGNQVSVYSVCDAAADAVNSVSKHFQGDTVYAVDSDSTVTYQNSSLANQGPSTLLLTADAIAPVANADEFQGVGSWVAK